MATTLAVDPHGNPRLGQGPSSRLTNDRLPPIPPIWQPSHADTTDRPAYGYPEQRHAIPQNEIWLLEYNEIRMAQLDEAVRSLPTYAGLLAAITSGFLIAGYSKLEPDYPEYIAKLLFEIHINGADNMVMKTLDPHIFTIPVLVKITVGLWVCSLLCAFGVVLGSLQVRRWLDHHTRMTTTPNIVTQTWLTARTAYTRDIVQWRFNFVVPLLHSTISISLLLLLAGIVTALSPRDLALSFLAIIAIALVLALYLCHFLRPLFRQCDNGDNSDTLERGGGRRTPSPTIGSLRSRPSQ